MARKANRDSKILRKAIKDDLLDQLERNGTVGSYYTDLVDKYMDFWDTENLLIQDIEQRGVVTIYNNGGGQSGVKKNDSIDQRIKVSAQMLKILDALGIKPATAPPDGDDDEL